MASSKTKPGTLILPDASKSVPGPVDLGGFQWQKKIEAPYKHIKVLEEAVNDAHRHGNALATSFKGFLKQEKGIPDEPRLRKWIKRIRDLARQHEDFRVLVGVAGATGAGKTSLLNALLDKQGFLPSSSQEAATASICQIAWNSDENPSKQYRAIIKFRSRQDIKKDLDQVLEDLRIEKPPRKADAPPEGDEDEGSDDDEGHREVLDAELEKIHKVWGLTEEQLQDMTSENVLQAKCHANTLIGQDSTFETGDFEEFSTAVGPYLDSTVFNTDSGEAFEIWPLIDHVEVYLKAPILEDGVVLVDLPGLGDAVESRANVAQRYYSELAVTIIVTPVIRAADERTTASILSEQQALSMQMDDKFNSRQFCVATSKIDDINCGRDIKAAKPGTELHAADMVIRTLQPEIEKLEDTMRVQQKNLQGLRRAIKTKREANKNAASLASKIPNIPGETEARCKQVNMDRKKVRELSKAYCNASVAKRAKDRLVVHARGTCRYICIRNRNAHVTRRIQADFKKRKQRLSRRLKTKKVGDDTIKVFPVSTQAYWEVKNPADEGSQPVVGFPDINYTGVPALAAWIREATIPAREAHAKAVLNKQLNLFYNVRTWSDDQCRDSAVLYDRAKINEDLLQPFLLDLQKELRQIGGNLYKEVKAVDPLRNARTTMETCRPNAVNCVRRWILKTLSWPSGKDIPKALKMPWNTHDAIVRRRGARYVGRGAGGFQYSWMQDLAAVFLQGLVEVWHDALHRELPVKADHVAGVIERCWTVSVQRLGERLLAFFPGQKNEIVDMVRNAVMSISDESRQVHPQVATALQNRWGRGFKIALKLKAKKAMTVNGIRIPKKGARDARQEYLESYAQKNVIGHFHAVAKEMRDRFQENIERVPQKLDSAWKTAENRVSQQLELILGNIIRAEYGSADEEERTLSTKHLLQQKARPHIVNWSIAWNLPTTLEKTDMEEDHSIPSEYVPKPTDNDVEDEPEDSDSDDEPEDSNSDDDLGRL